LQSVHGFCDNIHLCNLIALYTANAYSAEREMSASACIRSMPDFIKYSRVLYPQPHSGWLTVTSYNQPVNEEQLWLTSPKETTSTSGMCHM